MSLVVLEQFLDIDVTNGVAIGQHEGLVTHVILDALHATASLCIQSGVDNRNPPWFYMLAMNNQLIAPSEVKGHVRGVQEVVGKPLLDHVLPIAGAYNEIIETIMGIHFHDVPQDGHTTNFHHRFRTELRLLGNAGTETARKDHDFHAL